MSCNVDSVTTPVLDAWMHAKDIVALADSDDLAEGDFIRAHYQEAKAALNARIGCTSCATANERDARFCKKCGAKLPETVSELRITLRHFSWHGEGSGYAFDVLKTKIAPKVMGRVEAVFAWEGGNGHTGLLIEDGKVTECKVEMRLVKP